MKILKNINFILLFLIVLLFAVVSFGMTNNSNIYSRFSSGNNRDSDSNDEETIQKKANITQNIITQKIIVINNQFSKELNNLFSSSGFLKIPLQNAEILLRDKIKILSDNQNFKTNQKEIGLLNDEFEYFIQVKNYEIFKMTKLINNLHTIINNINIKQDQCNASNTNNTQTPIFYSTILNRSGALSINSKYDRNPGEIDIAGAIKKFKENNENAIKKPEEAKTEKSRESNTIQEKDNCEKPYPSQKQEEVKAEEKEEPKTIKRQRRKGVNKEIITGLMKSFND